MFPDSYLDNAFIEEFDQAYKELPNDSIFDNPEIRARKESLIRILNFLESSNIKCNLTKKDIEDSWNQRKELFQSLKGQIIHSFIKKEAYTGSERVFSVNCSEEATFSKYCCFFTGNSYEKASEKSNELGRIIIGKKFLEKPFFLNHTFPPKDTDATLYQIESIRHPCSTLLIIDKYLFQDTTKLESKIPNLIKVIEWMLPKELSRKFEITIISENTNSKLSNSISSKFGKIYDHFGDKISLQVYAPIKLNEIEASDRYLLSNYSLISIPHPFDRPTTISCNFWPSHPQFYTYQNEADISESPVVNGFNTWKNKIIIAKKVMKRTPPKIGTVQYIWKSENLEHEVFEM